MQKFLESAFLSIKNFAFLIVSNICFKLSFQFLQLLQFIETILMRVCNTGRYIIVELYFCRLFPVEIYICRPIYLQTFAGRNYFCKTMILQNFCGRNIFLQIFSGRTIYLQNYIYMQTFCWQKCAEKFLRIKFCRYIVL